MGHVEAKCIKEGIEGLEKKKETVKKDVIQSEIGVSEGLSIVGEGSNQEKEIEEGQVVEEWLTPGKTGRSSIKQNQTLKYGEVKIITPSRYSALSIPDEENMDIEVEELKKNQEVEVTNEEAEVEVEQDTSQDERDKENEHYQRQILPRESKTRHKILSEDVHVAKPSNMNKKGSRKNRQ